MARIRTIKPEFFLDEELSDVSPNAQLLFIGLWTLADKEGRLEDRPKRIKASIFPYRDVDVDACLDELASVNCIQRYEAEEVACISIPGFKKHQRPHPKEASSTLPEPPSREKVRLSREVSRQGAEASRRVPPGREGVLGREGVFDTPGKAPGRVVKEKPPPPAPFAQPPSPAVQAHAAGPPLVERLGAVFQHERGHPWQPHPRHDAEAVTAVLRASGGDEPEILRRWAIALRTGYPRCKNLRDLAEHWNSYGAEPPGLPAKPVDPGRLARPESTPCAVRGCSTPSEGEVWGQRLCPWHFGRADRELDATQLNARGVKAWVTAQVQAGAA